MQTTGGAPLIGDGGSPAPFYVETAFDNLNSKKTKMKAVFSDTLKFFFIFFQRNRLHENYSHNSTQPRI